MNYQRRSLNGLTHYLPSKAFNGYSLFPPLFGKEVFLIDMQGQVVNRWKMPFTPGVDAELLPNGNLLWAGKLQPMKYPVFGGSGGLLREVDWDGNVIWEYEDPDLSHCFCRLSNGNTLVARWEAMPDDLTKKVKGGLPGTELEGIMYGCGIQEITPSKEIVWECATWEKLDPDVDILCPCCPRDRFTNLNALYELPDGRVVSSNGSGVPAKSHISIILR
jgi:hypothetical protein